MSLALLNRRAHLARELGSQQIATLHAMRGLRRWLWREQPRAWLEVGAGLGTLTSVLLDYAVRFEVPGISLEPDPWYRQRLKELWALQPFVRVVEHAADCPSGSIDGLVVDGPFEAWEVLRERAMVFVEGSRRDQRAALEHWLVSRQWPFCRLWSKPWDRSKGYWLYTLTPSRWRRVSCGIEQAVGWVLDRIAYRCGVRVGKRRDRR